MAPRGKKRSGSRRSSHRGSSGDYGNGNGVMAKAWMWSNLVLAMGYLALAIIAWIWLTDMDKKLGNQKMPPTWVQVEPWPTTPAAAGEKPKPHLNDVNELKPSDFRVFFLIMFLVAATVHVFKAVNPSGIYTSFVMTGNNWIKWFEMFIAMPLMVVIVASFAGVYPLSSILGLVLLVITYTLVAAMMEYFGTWHMTSKDRGNVVTTFGGMAMTLPLVLSLIFISVWGYIIYSWSNASYSDNAAPGFKFPDWITLLVFAAFIVALWHYSVVMAWYFSWGNPWRNTLFHEIYLFFWRVGIPLIVLFGWQSEVDN